MSLLHHEQCNQYFTSLFVLNNNSWTSENGFLIPILWELLHVSYYYHEKKRFPKVSVGVYTCSLRTWKAVGAGLLRTQANILKIILKIIFSILFFFQVYSNYICPLPYSLQAPTLSYLLFLKSMGSLYINYYCRHIYLYAYIFAYIIYLYVRIFAFVHRYVFTALTPWGHVVLLVYMFLALPIWYWTPECCALLGERPPLHSSFTCLPLVLCVGSRHCAPFPHSLAYWLVFLLSSHLGSRVGETLCCSFWCY